MAFFILTGEIRFCVLTGLVRLNDRGPMEIAVPFFTVIFPIFIMGVRVIPVGGPDNP